MLLSFLLLIGTILISCEPAYKHPGQVEIRGFKIGDRVDTTLFRKHRPIYFPNYLDGWNMDNYNKLPEEYEGLPIGIWMLKSDSSVALTLLENRILKITLSYVTNGEKREIADMLTQRFGREGDKTSYEETHPLQDWITYWNLETWEIEDVIFQIGNSDMRKPRDPVPSDLPWNLVYSDLLAESKIVSEYRGR